MNLAKKMKRHGLDKLLAFEPLYAQIEREAIESGDPRVNDPEGVSEQLQAIRVAIQELREENNIPIPGVTVGIQTLELKASIDKE